MVFQLGISFGTGRGRRRALLPPSLFLILDASTLYLLPLLAEVSNPSYRWIVEEEKSDRDLIWRYRLNPVMFFLGRAPQVPNSDSPRGWINGLFWDYLVEMLLLQWSHMVSPPFDKLLTTSVLRVWEVHTTQTLTDEAPPLLQESVLGKSFSCWLESGSLSHGPHLVRG